MSIFLIYQVNISVIISDSTLSFQHDMAIAVLKSEHRMSSQNWVNHRGTRAHETAYAINETLLP